MIQKIAEIADRIEKLKRSAKHAERVLDNSQKGKELPRNQSKPVTDNKGVSFPWWFKESAMIEGIEKAAACLKLAEEEAEGPTQEIPVSQMGKPLTSAGMRKLNPQGDLYNELRTRGFARNSYIEQPKGLTADSIRQNPEQLARLSLAKPTDSREALISPILGPTTTGSRNLVRNQIELNNRQALPQAKPNLTDYLLPTIHRAVNRVRPSWL